MYMTAIKEVNKHIIYIIIRRCYVVEYVKLLLTVKHHIFWKTDTGVVEGWASKMTSTSIWDHGLGAQP